jgi:hypothetical protein
MTYVLRASIDALNTWITRGTPPPMARLRATEDSKAPLLLDADGNVNGGIRTPQMDAPVAALSGSGSPAPDSAGSSAPRSRSRPLP